MGLTLSKMLDLKNFATTGRLLLGAVIRSIKIDDNRHCCCACDGLYTPHLECRPRLSLYTQCASLLRLTSRDPSAIADH